MLYTFGTAREVRELMSRFPKDVVDELLTGVMTLEKAYGEERNYREIGGYSIVAETEDDLPALREVLNIDTRPCEWVSYLGNSGFLSVLYVLNNDFSIILIIPERIAPPIIKDDI